MRKSKILSLDEAYEEKLEKARTPGAKDIKPRKKKGYHKPTEEDYTKYKRMRGMMSRQEFERTRSTSYGGEVEKALVSVKGHMAGGHFIKPHFRKPSWLVTFANGEKTKVSAISKWAALQEAKQYSALAPITIEEEK